MNILFGGMAHNQSGRLEEAWPKFKAEHNINNAPGVDINLHDRFKMTVYEETFSGCVTYSEKINDTHEGFPKAYTNEGWPLTLTRSTTREGWILDIIEFSEIELTGGRKYFGNQRSCTVSLSHEILVKENMFSGATVRSGKYGDKCPESDFYCVRDVEILEASQEKVLFALRTGYKSTQTDCFYGARLI